MENAYALLFALIATGLCRAAEIAPTMPAVSETGDPRPPFMNRIVRVNRGPHVPSSIEEDASLFLKSPVYQLRFRPNRLSQFHGYPILNGQMPNSNGLSILNMPGMVTHHHPPTVTVHSSQPGIPGGEDSDEISSSLDESQQPTFTPFISARALSNIEKFFEHLRENIEALQTTDPGSLTERPQRSNGDDEGGSEDSARVWWDDSAESPNALSSGYRGGFRWSPPASGAHNRDNRDQASFYYLDQDSGKSRPKFNPSWVKLGLGKRK